MKSFFFDLKVVASVLAVFLVLTSFSCEKNNEKAAVNELLINCWTNSYEENTSQETELYRPCDFKDFPPSRFRMKFQFDENQQCSYTVLSPNDAHYAENGSWEYITQTRTVIIRNESGETVYELKIIELEEDKLVLTIQR